MEQVSPEVKKEIRLVKNQLYRAKAKPASQESQPVSADTLKEKLKRDTN
jgi:hypothetical protein